MSITIGDKPEQNVVNVGDELTADQLAALQNAQGASATNPVLTRTNTFNTADAAVRITQDGTGDAFRVEDVTGDASPFVIAADGRVGVGRSPTAGYSLDVAGNFLAAASTVSLLISGSSAIVSSSSSSDAFRITHTGTGNSFVVEDSTNPDTTPFVVTADGNVGISVATPTNKLQVAGNVLFSSGNFQISNAGTASSLTVSNTNIGMANVGSSFSYAGTGDAVRITNTGTGNSFVVEDDTNPDSTAFKIENDGRVSILGNTVAGYGLTVNGDISVSQIAATNIYGRLISCTTTLPSQIAGTFTNTSGSTVDCVRITNLGTGNSFVVEDETNPDTTPFLISASGDVAIGTSTPNGKLRVTGRSYFENTSGAGGNAVVWARSSASSSVPVLQVTCDSNHLGAGAIIELNNTASTADAVRITNLGTGNSFVVEDSTNPDSSPFVINNDGSVGIGTTTPSTKLAVIGSASFAGATSVSTSGSNAFTVSVTNTSSGVIGSLIDYRGTGNAFRIVNNTTETFNIAGSGAVTLTNYLTLHSGSLATAVGSQTYSDELEFKVGSTIYRVPARAI